MTETAEVATADDLAALLADQLRMVHMFSPDRPKGWQQLTCAPDVAEALTAVIREADEADPRPHSECEGNCRGWCAAPCGYRELTAVPWKLLGPA